MAVEFEDLVRAVGVANAVLREHEQQPHEHLQLSDEARESIRGMIDTQIRYSGVPRSRHAYRSELLKFTEVGMILGREIERARTDHGD